MEISSHNREPGPLARLGIASSAPGNCTQSEVFNCWSSPSCCDPQALCFAKMPGVAICKRECHRGVDLNDPDGFRSPWSCEERPKKDPVDSAESHPQALESVDSVSLANGTSVPSLRSAVGWCTASYSVNCLSNPNCCDGSKKCYRRDSIYGACLPYCNRGIHWQDPPQYRLPWSCEEVFPWQPPAPAPPAPSPPGRCTASYTANCKWTRSCCERDQGFDHVKLEVERWAELPNPPCDFEKKRWYDAYPLV
eukprot:Skav226823  [mRNA]  locus=scaffold606:168186:179703:+ [translate_table: standard]